MSKPKNLAHLIPYNVVSVQNTVDQVPYGVERVDAPSVWEKGEKGKGVVIAVLDTGCDITHPDLKDRIIDGKNFTAEGEPTDFADRNGHGTHVCGTICASAQGLGVVGVAPEASLLVVKVLDGDGSGSYQSIIDGINYAIEWRGSKGERVRVMNMSLGGSEDDPELKATIKKATLAEIAMVVASGNEGDSDEGSHEFGFPGFYNEVIEVAASDEKNQLAPFSNNNLQVDVIAPGVNIVSTYLNGRYATLSGTSMATPHVAGALALLINISEKHFKRELTECEIYANLVKHLIPLGYQASSEGHGLVRLDYSNRLRAIVNYIERSFC